MKYPIAIEPGSESEAFVVVVPDLPGCYSAGDTLDEALDNAREAIELWIETVLDDNGVVPAPSSIDRHQSNPAYAGWIWGVVPIDLTSLADKVEQVNITLPARVLRRIDAAAQAAGESREAYMTKKALIG